MDRASNQLDCTKMRGFLDAFMDHQLSVEAILQVTDHLERCPECRRQVHEGMRLKRALRKAVTLTPLPYSLGMRVRTDWMEGR